MTKKVEIRLWCNSSTSVLISGYIIGSPTRDKAQCLGDKPSSNFSCVTPAGRHHSSTRLICIDDCVTTSSLKSQLPTKENMLLLFSIVHELLFYVMSVSDY